MIKYNRAAALLLTTIALHTNAQVYKHVDEQGNITFSDHATAAHTKPVTINTPNSLPPPVQHRATVKENPALTKESLKENYSISISNLSNDAVIPPGPGNFDVNVQVSPKLARGHRVQLWMDGKPVTAPQLNTLFKLSNVFRGSHQIHAVLINANNKIVNKSEPVLIHVFRPIKRN